MTRRGFFSSVTTLGFFVVGLVLIYGLSFTIFSAITHYVDGLFFSQLCFLLAVMTEIDLLHKLPEVFQTRKWVGDYLMFQLGRSPDYGGFSNNMDNLILSEQEWVI
ncbi:hypothetical protein PTTG_05997 [Puccinia triticina 1-1 BBBD Race 1]|uniref:Chitin synthase export chaperone n=1 Tax=Puccinia triticina (isolate 1-1 / race 1 (BBBD)) TaxID=630390 RepID=A0A0C4EYU2_PUCT1|nr:hypothetical protein PTTG_05997 [Puccinia triticina 1-1 BBBD Race 1]